MRGVIHAGSDADNQLLSKTILTRSKEGLLSAAGSRYTPASPCEGMKAIANDPGQWIFIGKPCDAAGVRKGQAADNRPVKNVGLIISIFCAGTPSTKGTIDLIKSMRISPEEVKAIRYRGHGWPGLFRVELNRQIQETKVLSYHEAWGFLQKYRPYRCHLCPDGTGEFADIACGDPWYREIKANEQGHSIILVRTDRGRAILRSAISAGFIKAEMADPSILERSQPNLLSKRAAVWGRLLAFRLFGLPVPRYAGFPLFNNWLTLSFSEKARSIFGTMRRIVQRKYYTPINMDEEVTLRTHI
jgi:coenzyme F420 hydrogenase subunit beta